MLENPWGTWMPASMSDLSPWSKSLWLQSACCCSFYASLFVKCLGFKRQSHQVSCHATVPHFHPLVCFWICCLCQSLGVFTALVILVFDGPLELEWTQTGLSSVWSSRRKTTRADRLHCDACPSTPFFLLSVLPAAHVAPHIHSCFGVSVRNLPKLWI